MTERAPVNRPAWMSNGPVAAMTGGAAEGGAVAGETRAAALTSAVAAGRGRGRGAGINIPAWMANGNWPRAAQASGTDAEAAAGAATGEAWAAQAAAEEDDATEGTPRPPNWSGMNKSHKNKWKRQLAGKRR